MVTLSFRRLILGAAAAAVLGVSTAFQVASAPAVEPRVDAVFRDWSTSTPGCAVGVSQNGSPTLTKAYGMADLEHGIANTAETIFEAGSVSKQFTAAAMLLLARDGKLSLDDEARQYVPELPNYGRPVTIRHMLTHTSGLRDWGSLAAISGWPRGRRAHTHGHVLDILSRQRGLNFVPGSHYSYSNSGYNLAAVIISRVSGMSFAEFSRQRLFEPLGMTSTSWRDDFTRLVPGRATAYSGGRGNAAYHLSMPFEDVHGNGGLLTTVGDLLVWNENFVTPVVGDADLVAQQQEKGLFSDGTENSYAFGLRVASYKGVPEVSHSGSTAGYRAYLARYPDQHTSVAVLCNAASANATQAAHAVADLYLGDVLDHDPPPTPVNPATRGPLAALRPDPQHSISVEELAEFAGTYTSIEIETTVTLAVEDGRLVLHRRPDSALIMEPQAADRFQVSGIGMVTFHRQSGRVVEFGVTQDRVWDLRFKRSR